MIKPRFGYGIVNWKSPKTRVPGSTVHWWTVHWSHWSLDSLLNLVRNNFANWNINLWSGLLRTSTKTRTSASTLGTGTRASKIQDGEDVDVLRSPDLETGPLFYKMISSATYLVTVFLLYRINKNYQLLHVVDQDPILLGHLPPGPMIQFHIPNQQF